MLNPTAIATQYWASHLGCSPEELFARPMGVITHGSEWTDSDGAFALFRGETSNLSLPPARAGTLRALLPTPANRLTPEALVSALTPLPGLVVGPAYIGYASHAAPILR